MKESVKKFLEFNGRTIYFLAVDGTYWIAIKPICEALGVKYDHQREKIKKDAILCKLPRIHGVVAADNKVRNMLCLPEEYVYGWLFSIQSNSPDLLKYKLECYHYLWEYFRGVMIHQDFYQHRKFIAERDIKKLEAELESNEIYQQLLKRKDIVADAKNHLRNFTRKFIESQMDLWESDPDFNIESGEVEESPGKGGAT